MMIGKPTMLVISSIAIGIIIMAVMGTYAQSPSPTSQADRQAQTEVSADVKGKTSVGSKSEPAQNQNSQNTVTKPNSNVRGKTSVGSKSEQAQNQNPNIKVLITGDKNTINITVINTDTGNQIGKTLSFAGTVRESKIVGDELRIISEVQSQGRTMTEFRNIDLTNIYVINSLQIPGKISQTLH